MQTIQMSDPIKQALASAIQFHQAGNLAAAESIYQDILRSQPAQPDALHLLGTIALHHGDFAYASELISQAIALNKKVPQYHVSLAHALKAQNQLELAAKHYGLALRLKPDLADAHQSLGNLLLQQGDHIQSIKHLKSAVHLSGTALAHYNLGTAFLKSGDHAAAANHLRQALALDDHLAAAHLNLATALHQLDDSDGALRHFEHALALQPDSAEAHLGIGNIRAHNNDVTQAMAHFRQAIALQPEFANAHLNLAHACLKNGNLREGWREYEWRLKIARPAINIPQWDGAPLNGKRLLVMAEQGAGDTMQFVRYLPLLRNQAEGDILFACHRSLLRLLKPIAGAAPMLEIEKLDPHINADCHVNLMSLPFLFNTEPATIPSTDRYLAADLQLAGQWRQRLTAHHGFRIGIAWAGNPANGNDRFRSFNPQHFSKLSAIPGITLFSLQKGQPKKAADLICGVPLVDYTREFNDFADTAAFIGNLDLVITIDTSIAHLSGALGKPVWTLLHLGADWRYAAEGSSCPWYASMRLFRQTARGDWDSVFAQLVPALKEHVDARA